MLALAQFLLSITGPIVSRVLLSLGFGFITYEALSPLVSNFINHIRDNYSSIDDFPLTLLNLAGFGEALGIIAGAITTNATMQALKKLHAK
jgi:hypothetical protein